VSAFSRITQPVVCVECERSRREIPAEVRETTNARGEANIGRMMAVGAIVLGGFVIIVPARLGAAPSSKLYLLAMAFVALGAGLKKVADAKRKLGSKLK
jgi:hypothetical protein